MDEIKERFRNLTDASVSLKACIAELLGTCLFVLLGLLSLVFSSIHDPPITNVYVTDFTVAFTFGIGILSTTYMTRHTSGGHLNPAITCGAMAAGAMSIAQGVAHIICQCLGAILGAALLACMAPPNILKLIHLGVNEIPDSSSVGAAFLGEMVGMFMIVLVVLETAYNPKSEVRNCAPLAIGLTFTVVILAFASVSSGSFNPARSLGPALLSLHMKDLWVFVVAPTIGGLLAAPVHLLFYSDWDTKRTVPVAQRAQQRAADAVDSASEALLGNRGAAGGGGGGGVGGNP